MLYSKRPAMKSVQSGCLNSLRNFVKQCRYSSILVVVLAPGQSLHTKFQIIVIVIKTIFNNDTNISRQTEQYRHNNVPVKTCLVC